MSNNQIGRFESSDVLNSITNPDSTIYDDNDQPYTLLEWVDRINGDVGSVDQFVKDYNNYVKQWRTETNQTTAKAKTTIKNVYIRFLKEIVTNYTTNEEKRFLKNIDFTNRVEVDAAIPFFTARIRDIIIFIQKNRHQSKFQKVKYSLKGSSRGLEKAIFDTIVKYVTGEDVSSFSETLPTVEDFVKNTRISFTETYDLSETYADTQYLYTTGGEFLLPTGVVYTGYYHIHEQLDGSVLYMTGKEHTKIAHDTLTRVDFRIPLQSNISTANYSGTTTPDTSKIGGTYYG